MSWGKRLREKCYLGKNVTGRKVTGRNVSGRNGVPPLTTYLLILSISSGGKFEVAMSEVMN